MMFYVDSSLPYWVTVIAALIAGTPAYLALIHQRRRDISKKGRADYDQALHGFEILLDELRVELDRRSRAFERDLVRAEAICEERIRVARVEARREMRSSFNELVEAYNGLDRDFNEGKNQIERQ